MSSTRVLLLGGHGKVSLLMTPLLLSRSWHVTSLIRDANQTSEIQACGSNQPGKIDVLVESLDDVTSVPQAQRIIEKVQPEYVIWSAGAGGKGGASRTYAIDRDAARHFITAATQVPSVRKFLMVSYLGSRRNRAPWWTDEDWTQTKHVNEKVLVDYGKAKVEADECLVARAKARRDQGGTFHDIVLRPGTLTDHPVTGKVALGHISARGEVTRADVADVAIRLLETEARGYFDLLEGSEDVQAAVDRVVRDKIDCFDGEDLEAIVKKYQS